MLACKVRELYLLLCKKLWRQQQDGAHARLPLLCACVHCHHALWVAKAPLLLRGPLQNALLLSQNPKLSEHCHLHSIVSRWNEICSHSSSP